MEYRQLADSELRVSRLGLGSMMWGSQNTEAEAHAQLDYAVSRGINFIDTAECYAIPPEPATQGLSEQYLGSWLAGRADRDQLVIATKVTGRSDYTWIRGENTRLNRQQIEQAVDASLRRLQLETIDLYQLHWPDRIINNFGIGGPNYTHYDVESVPLQETLAVMADLIKAGKIRYVGLSNETPWGLSHCLKLAETVGLPKVVSVQNAFNLLNRSYETGLSEFYYREGIGLLAYSPLGQGTITGKYLDGARPAGARKTLYSRFSRYEKAGADPAIRQYVELARQHGLDPAQMALAFVYQKPFVQSTIIGGSNIDQLASNIDALALSLSDEVMAGIEAIHLASPNPCP